MISPDRSALDARPARPRPGVDRPERWSGVCSAGGERAPSSPSPPHRPPVWRERVESRLGEASWDAGFCHEPSGRDEGFAEGPVKIRHDRPAASRVGGNRSMRTSWDAIIVGASFAGLAVARGLRGRVLLVDRSEVGTVQTSACGTPLWVPRALSLESSILQVHDRLELRTPTRTITYDLTDAPFCTFDFGTFARGLLAQGEAAFLRAPVVGSEPGAVITTVGRLTAPVVVDASGWRGVVVNRGRPPRARAGGFSFGLEARTPVDDDKLTLVVDPRTIRHGLAWIFPVGRGSLIGLGSYRGESQLGGDLRRLLDDLGAPTGSLHGTFFPNRLRAATTAGVFAVGDAAGQCLPLTAEGIRPALYFGDVCGRIIQRVIDGRLTLGEGLRQYERLVDRYRRAYAALRRAQWLAAYAPSTWFGALAAAFARPPLVHYWWPRYGLFGPLGARSNDGSVMARGTA